MHVSLPVLIAVVLALVVMAATMVWLLNRRASQDVNTLARDAGHPDMWPPPRDPSITPQDPPEEHPTRPLRASATAKPANEAVERTDPLTEKLEAILAEDWTAPPSLGLDENGYDVVMLDRGDRPVLVLRLLRAVTPQTSLDGAIAAIRTMPFTVLRNAPAPFAERARKAFDAIGCRMELR